MNRRALLCGAIAAPIVLSLPNRAWAQTYLVEDYGAKADFREIGDAYMAAGSPLLTSASNPFTIADVGKIILVNGSATAGGVQTSHIKTFISPGEVELFDNAVTVVGMARAQYATDSTPGIQTAVNLAKITGGEVHFQSAGKYGVTSINCTNPTRSFCLVGRGPTWWGTRLVPMANVNAVVDATGHDAFSIKKLTIGGSNTQLALPTAGLLLAPSEQIQGMSVPLFEQFATDGSFDLAGAYIDRVYGGLCVQAGFGNYWQGNPIGETFTAVFTGSNILNVTSHFVTIKSFNPSAPEACHGWSFLRSEAHNIDSNLGAGVCNTLYLENFRDSAWNGGIIAGGYTSPVMSGFGCSNLHFADVQFSFDMSAGYPYVFSGQPINRLVLNIPKPAFNVAFNSMPLPGLVNLRPW